MFELVRHQIGKLHHELNLKRLSFGDNTPPALPARDFSFDVDPDLPPPIPERKCSLECFLDVEFERRFTFRPMSTCRLPEPFSDCKKTYPSKQPRRKGLQRPAVEPPPPPPPQDFSPSSSPNSPSGIFTLSSPPFKLGAAKKTTDIGAVTNAATSNTKRNSQNYHMNGSKHDSNNGNTNKSSQPLPPPPPDPLMSSNLDIQKLSKIGNGKTDFAEWNMYSKAVKPKLNASSKNETTNLSRNSRTDTDVFGEINCAQIDTNGIEQKIPPLPPSLIPPPPSKPLPPPPLSAKPNLLGTNSNQAMNIVTAPSATGNDSKHLRSSFSSDSLSAMKTFQQDVEKRNGSKKSQRSISTPSPPPVTLSNRISTVSPSLKPKPAMLQHGNGNLSHAISGTSSDHKLSFNSCSKSITNNQSSSSANAFSDKVAALKNKMDSGESIHSSISCTSKKNTSHQPSPTSNGRPLLPPKKENLLSNFNSAPSSFASLNQSKSTPSFQKSKPSFSSHPLPPPPPPPPAELPVRNSETTASLDVNGHRNAITNLPQPPPTPSHQASTQALTKSSSSSSISSLSSLSSSRKLSTNSNKNRPLPPPPPEEDINHASFGKKPGSESDYGDGWGGKELFDPREEDGDLYDLMDSTNM